MPNGYSVRAVIDTNVLVSGILWHGAPHAIMEKVRGRTLTFISSPGLIAELAGVIERKKFAAAMARSAIDPAQVLVEIALLAEIFDPPPPSAPYCRDPDDDAVLALAATARPDLIITGDHDLLILGGCDGIPIVSPADALVAMGNSAK